MLIVFVRKYLNLNFWGDMMPGWQYAAVLNTLVKYQNNTILR